jgi:hypothetical protein
MTNFYEPDRGHAEDDHQRHAESMLQVRTLLLAVQEHAKKTNHLEQDILYWLINMVQTYHLGSDYWMNQYMSLQQSQHADPLRIHAAYELVENCARAAHHTGQSVGVLVRQALAAAAALMPPPPMIISGVSPDQLRELTASWRKEEAAAERAKRPLIVCLCGSTRFHDQFMEANYQRTMQGQIVLAPGFFIHSAVHGESVGCTAEEKIELDKLHMEKIRMADEILVINVGGYFGDSTRNEIKYAVDLGKPIRWLEEDKAPDMIDFAPF